MKHTQHFSPRYIMLSLAGAHQSLLSAIFDEILDLCSLLCFPLSARQLSLPSVLQSQVCFRLETGAICVLKAAPMKL